MNAAEMVVEQSERGYWLDLSRRKFIDRHGRPVRHAGGVVEEIKRAPVTFEAEVRSMLRLELIAAGKLAAEGRIGTGTAMALEEGAPKGFRGLQSFLTALGEVGAVLRTECG